MRLFAVQCHRRPSEQGLAPRENCRQADRDYERQRVLAHRSAAIRRPGWGYAAVHTTSDSHCLSMPMPTNPATLGERTGWDTTCFWYGLEHGLVKLSCDVVQ